ncbi:hypothetical protein HYZ78_01640 [Candidatus Microgenomates bacterium]|nr:hypothetical protein [Candidatus Microgenomates bacterium]
MNRYQIYLKPESVGVLDELSRLTNFSRSRIIRDVIDKMATEYKKIITATQKSRDKDNPLLKMAGFAKGPGRDIARNVNDIYFND